MSFVRKERRDPGRWGFHLMKLLLTGLLVLCPISVASAGEAAEDAIQHMLSATFDKGSLRVIADPVVVDGDVAVASWTQGEKGGRALFRLKKGSWGVVLCGGDALKEAQGLTDVGVAPDAAARIATRLDEAERKASPERRALFSTFKGLMPMEGHAVHITRAPPKRRNRSPTPERKPT